MEATIRDVNGCYEWVIVSRPIEYCRDVEMEMDEMRRRKVSPPWSIFPRSMK